MEIREPFVDEVLLDDDTVAGNQGREELAGDVVVDRPGLSDVDEQNLYWFTGPPSLADVAFVDRDVFEQRAE